MIEVQKITDAAALMQTKLQAYDASERVAQAKQAEADQAHATSDAAKKDALAAVAALEQLLAQIESPTPAPAPAETPAAVLNQLEASDNGGQ